MAVRKEGMLAINWSMFKVYLAGFLAGALSLLTLILIVYFALAIFSLLFTLPSELIEAEVTETSRAKVSTLNSIVSSVENLFKGLWQARLGFLIFGILGTAATWVYQTSLLVRRGKAWLASFICMAVIIAVTFISWTYGQREEAALYLAENPELYRWRDLLLDSYATKVSVGIIFALAATYPIWALWRWWYIRLEAWLSPARPTSESESRASQNQTILANHLSYASRLSELKRGALPAGGQTTDQEKTPTKVVPTSALPERIRRKLIKSLAILLVLCLALLFFSNRYYNQVALRLQHGIAFLEPVTGAHQEFVVSVEPDIQRIRVVNINGVGTVSLYLSPTDDYQEAVARVDDWSFKWRRDQYLYTDIPVAGLTPGNYHLHFVQESGWGYFEYTLSQGGGTPSHIAALVTGVLLACSLVLGLALLLLGPARHLI
ncbi:MAG: hypothetical protein GWN77_02075 [Gammaproteobacteria bacterium]|nr:hypothetical protein [Gammaproteobacteria bacterium]